MTQFKVIKYLNELLASGKHDMIRYLTNFSIVYVTGLILKVIYVRITCMIFTYLNFYISNFRAKKC